MNYQPTKILGPKGGLVTQVEEFLLEDDEFVTLENAYLRFGKILRKEFPGLLGRLTRIFTAAPVNNATLANPWAFNFFSTLVTPIDKALTEPYAELKPKTVSITIGADTVTDQGNGTFNSSGNITGGTINYSTGNINLTFTAAPAGVVTADFYYSPGLPVMGLLQQETVNEGVETTIAFDTKYAYEYIFGISSWRELPSTAPTTWTGSDSSFFWSTNWGNNVNGKLFWVTNFSQSTGDPIRYYDTVTWTNFSPNINTGGDVLAQARILLPFRGRLLALNTWEGVNLAGSTNYPNRIRWSAIGDPLAADAWNEDTPGKGSFLDIPISENIISAGFVRDNLVIFCERTTWQLRYTGQAIAPFQIDRVNSDLGARGPFSSVAFDTNLMTIGNRGIISCDSFSVKRVDDKIQNFVFDFTNNDFNGPLRIYGIRDFQKLLAYWTYPSAETNSRYPDHRLVYNYNEDSWAIFKDSYTCLGLIYENNDTIWSAVDKEWQEIDWTWEYTQSQFPVILGGNQEGFVMKLTRATEANQSLAISDITGTTGNPAVFTIYNHNLQRGDIVQITDIPAGNPYNNLNGSVFGVVQYDGNNGNQVVLQAYNSTSQKFEDAVLFQAGTYSGYGRAAPMDNISIKTKKFNYLESGEKIQLGHIDLLTEKTENGSFTMNVYTNYADNSVNDVSDSYFNKVVDTSSLSQQQSGQDNTWQRVRCPSRGAFVQLEYTLSNAQMNGQERSKSVEIHGQVLWTRPAGKNLTTR